MLAVWALAASQTGCSTVAKGVSSVGQAAGVITPQQGDSLVKSAEAVERTFADITPEQEYFIGRSVGATIVNRYQVFDDDRATRYLNLVGQTLAQASDKPETFGGYHFLILDSDEINAFAAPGGFIFVSRGMLRLCRTEDDLAAVLAHEVAHVQLQHALRAIKSSRITSAFTILATEGAKSFGGQGLSELTTAFEGSIQDITGTMMNSGYARKQESQADAVAVTILKRVGYDASALVRVLEQMKSQLKPGGADFAKTHPDPNVRIREVQKLAGGPAASAAPAARQRRFDQSMRGI
jgi:predicted Zn-dependent protease